MLTLIYEANALNPARTIVVSEIAAVAETTDTWNDDHWDKDGVVSRIDTEIYYLYITLKSNPNNIAINFETKEELHTEYKRVTEILIDTK